MLTAHCLFAQVCVCVRAWRAICETALLLFRSAATLEFVLEGRWRSIVGQLEAAATCRFSAREESRWDLSLMEN